MKKTLQITIAFTISVFLFTQCDIFNKTPLELTVNGFDVEAYGKDNGSINIHVSGGKAPYTFIWSTGAKTQNINKLQAGTYKVTVTDNKKHSIIETITIYQPEPECVDIDGNIYQVTTIGSNLWMAENLRVKHATDGSEIKSFVYDNDSSLEKKYGRLYDWKTIMQDSTNDEVQGICPDGWHIPSLKEWQAIKTLFPKDSAGYFLNKKEFNPVMSGFKSANTYHGMDYYATYWTSTKNNDNAWKIDIYSIQTKLYFYHGNIYNSYAVRCIQDSIK